MKRVYTLPSSAITNETINLKPYPSCAVIRLTGIDAPQTTDTLFRAAQARTFGCGIEFSVSDHPEFEGNETPPSWVSIVWFTLRDWEQEDSPAWQLAKKMHDGLWPIGILLPLSVGNIKTLSEAIQRLSEELPALRELRLTTKACENEQRLSLDVLRTAFRAGLQAVRCAFDAGWKCEVRCEGLPLCAVDESDFSFFTGRNESEYVIPLNTEEVRPENVYFSKCCICADVCSLAPFGQCRENAEHSFWIPEARQDTLRTVSLYALCRGNEEIFCLNRYTDVIQNRRGIAIRSRLFGIEVFVPLHGAAQECFLDRLSAGMTADEIMTFFRKQGLESDLFYTMLKGCVFA